MSPTLPSPQGGGEVPHCYRHPDRETYIRCARCERPICPECMTEAPVGFQCPQCLREGAAPAVRTPYGGRVHADGALVTKILIAVCVAVYVAELALNPTVMQHFALFAPLVADGQYYRLLTVGFLHLNIYHIGFNMWALWIVGPPVERAFGRARFLLIYCAALLGGAIGSYVLGAPGVASVGASGAIFGLFGALAVISRRMGYSLQGVVVLIVINLVLSFTVTGIDWHAHVGGLVVGTSVAAALALPPRRLRTPLACGVLVLLALVGVGATVARTVALRPEIGPDVPAQVDYYEHYIPPAGLLG